MKKIDKNSFLYLAHCERGVPSSKRLYGGIGWMIVQICIFVACVLSFGVGAGITEILKDVLCFDLSISAALLGLSTITSVFGSNKVSTEEKKEQI